MGSFATAAAAAACAAALLCTMALLPAAQHSLRAPPVRTAAGRHVRVSPLRALHSRQETLRPPAPASYPPAADPESRRASQVPPAPSAPWQWAAPLALLAGAAAALLARPGRREGARPAGPGALATAAVLTALGHTAAVAPATALTLPVSEPQLYRDAWSAVKNSFIDKSFNGLDWEKERDQTLAQPLASREETYTAIRGSIQKLGDPFTRLLDPPQYNNIKRRLTGRLTGLGLEIVPVKEGGSAAMKVVDRTLGGPADKAGILDGDLIRAVDGEAVGERSQWVMADVITGKRNTPIILTVQSPGQEPRDLTLTRDEVIFQAVKAGLCEGVANQTWQDKPLEKLGYIRVPSFNYSTAAQFNRAMKDLTTKGADGIVIDLRSDTGGSLNAAYEMANSILPKGEIVRVVSYDGTVTSAQVRGRALFPDIPVTLLVDDFTASSSEVLAAALKASGRAAIAGEQTFGKGIIQDIKMLPDGSAVFVTKEKYLTPLNEEIDKVGIAPTVAVAPALLDIKTGLRTEPDLFCSDLLREAPPLFTGPAPPPPTSHPDLDLNSLSAFC